MIQTHLFIRLLSQDLAEAMLADPEVPPVPCKEQAKEQNLLCSKSFETSKLKSAVSKSCAKLLTQGCCFKVTFLLFSPTGAGQAAVCSTDVITC